ncbi:unnamed protein product [Polarella glacialis]|uniref:EF-hand domain-containing protein n=1 Tax=Polarella glacialis TaxID=89957 RepID=A0A813LVU6_POLGL|nr:unnamed protein product [Polarella glacialis]
MNRDGNGGKPLSSPRGSAADANSSNWRNSVTHKNAPPPRTQRRDKVLPKASEVIGSDGDTRTIFERARASIRLRTVRAPESREIWKQVVQSAWFDSLIGVVIVFNAAGIGIELTLQLEGKSTMPTQILENFCIVAYIAELGCRVFAIGFVCFRDHWVQFDTFLIFMGVLVNWILDPILGPAASSAFGPLMILRTARLLRLAKMMRLFKRFREFWILVRGIMTCATMMVYVFLVLFLCIYVFSCLAIELITMNTLNEEDEEFREQVQKYFRSLPNTMMTLVRFACLDNTSEVYGILVEKDAWLSVYFVFLILVISLVFFHLTGAVIFSTTMDTNAEEEDVAKGLEMDKWANLVKDLKEMFSRMDADGSGFLSRAEFEHIHPSDMKMLSRALGGGFSPGQIFDSLDVDRSGEVSITELFDGIWDVISSKDKLGTKRMEKQVELMHVRMSEMSAVQQSFMLTHKTLEGQIALLVEEMRLTRVTTAAKLRVLAAAPKVAASKVAARCDSKSTTEPESLPEAPNGSKRKQIMDAVL